MWGKSKLTMAICPLVCLSVPCWIRRVIALRFMCKVQVFSHTSFKQSMRLNLVPFLQLLWLSFEPRSRAVRPLERFIPEKQPLVSLSIQLTIKWRLFLLLLLYLLLLTCQFHQAFLIRAHDHCLLVFICRTPLHSLIWRGLRFLSRSFLTF